MSCGFDGHFHCLDCLHFDARVHIVDTDYQSLTFLNVGIVCAYCFGMSQYASKIWKARNLVELDNSLLVEWREIGKPTQSAICGSDKCYRQLINKLRRQGYVHLSKVF